MNQAKFSPRAERDLDEIFNHLFADNPDAANKIRETILATADLCAQHPELGSAFSKLVHVMRVFDG